MKAPQGLLGLIVVAGLAGPAWAADTPAPRPAATAPSGAPAMGHMSGMMGNGTGGGNMMGMMANMMPMMAGMMSSHVDARLAFLRTELKITAEQSAAWDRYAEAYRGAANSMHSMHGMGMMQGDLPSRLAAHQAMMAAHLEALKAISGPLNALYAVLSAEQKKSADDLIGMGM